MITWPQQLPRPQQIYSTLVDGRLVANEFEVGYRQRRRYSYLEDAIRLSWLLNQFQLDVFRAFVKFELDNGANAFNTSIIGLDGLEDAEVQLRDGVYQFAAIAPGYYTVSAALVRLAPTTMTLDMLGILGMPELADPDLFSSLCEILSVYIEEAYGDSGSNGLTSDFMELYS